jgi:predicted permease
MITRPLHDLIHAARTLTKARSFTAVCVTSLGLGMGVAIVIMTFVSSLLGTPHGVNDDGLVEVVIRPEGALLAESGNAIIDTFSYPDYLDVRDASEGMVTTGWSRAEAMFLPQGQTAPDGLAAMYVSSNYFSTIGVVLPLGPGFTPADDASVARPETVISHRMWTRRFGSDPGIIGRAVTIDRTEYVVVGVAPERFRGHVNGLDEAYCQLWLPLSHHPRLAGSGNVRASRDVSWVRIVGRLAEGTTLAEADARVQAVTAGLAARYPSSHQQRIGGVEPYFSNGARKRAQMAGAQLKMFMLAGIVMAIVALNLSGMMLVRSAMRERELAVRLAIGASRWRLMQYHLAEALVLALAGGGLASAVVFGGPAIAAWWFTFSGTELEVFRPSLGLVFQCLALCFVTSLVLGLLPAVRFSRPMILSSLKSDSKGGGRRVGRPQRLTAAFQAGIAIPFLVIGGIKVDQARVSMMADLGFQSQGLYAARLNLSTVGESDADRERFVRAVEQGLEQSPSVTAVSLADGVPLDYTYRNARVAREGESIFTTAHTTRIGPRYLETIGTRLLAGRTIDVRDTAAAERVVLLSQPLATELFPAGNPIGQRVSFALESGEPQAHTVVGITADLVSTQVGNPKPQLFVSLAQHPTQRIMAVARGASGDPSVRRTFEAALEDADPEYVLGELMTGEGLVEGSRDDLLVQGGVSGVAASVALALAALGVYGVIAFMVTMRTREIGVRVALGASRFRVLKDVLGDALKLVVPGIGFGLLLSVLWVRQVDPSWYPLGGVEPLVYASAAGVSLLVALLAGIPSARRASAVQPIIAMRAE